MPETRKLAIALLLLRLSIFLVMILWTFDKFLHPAHAAKVFETFYFIKPFGPKFSYTIGAIELCIVVAFVVGYKKWLSYGSVLFFHALSTAASYAQFMAPYQGSNLLFFTAWPMLAACIVLYVLRDYDTLWSFD